VYEYRSIADGKAIPYDIYDLVQNSGFVNVGIDHETAAFAVEGISKWNKIEHRLFSYISINWRGKPLTSLETIIELISHTTTEEGLTVTAVKDANIYPTGIKVSDEDMATLNISRNSFHGEWNYTIHPQYTIVGTSISAGLLKPFIPPNH
jgi:hypothetical protein